MNKLLQVTKNGLYCEQGDFYIDPLYPVKHAVITHGHADHARFGMGHYISTPETADIIKKRIGENITISEYAFKKIKSFNGINLYFIPAGHILGSAQVVIESNNERAIITGDFKLSTDATVDSFEHLTCDLLVMETTFALPCYHWDCQKKGFKDIEAFWKENQKKGKNTVLYAYSLGKAQRLLAGLNSNIGPIAVHGAVELMNKIYKKHKRLKKLPQKLTKDYIDTWTTPGLIIAPPSTQGSTWLKKCHPINEAYVSGWMHIKGQTRRRNMKGFTLSDHADWAECNKTVIQSKAKEVWTTHGYTDIFSKYLNEMGIKSFPVNNINVQRSAD